MWKAIYIFFFIFTFATVVELAPTSDTDVACADCDVQKVHSRPKRFLWCFINPSLCPPLVVPTVYYVPYNNVQYNPYNGYGYNYGNGYNNNGFEINPGNVVVRSSNKPSPPPQEAPIQPIRKIEPRADIKLQ